MNPAIAVRTLFASGLLLLTAPAQDWTDEQLVNACPGFQNESLPQRLDQVGKLLAERKAAFTALVARIHGDHREYRLKIDRLLGELADPRWQVRENAERTLIEVGGRAFTEIQAKKEKYDVLDQQIRCARILDALVAKGTEQEDREKRTLRGLVLTALYLDGEPRLLRALRSALGHTNAAIADGAIRALGKHGGDDEADAVAQIVAAPNSIHRLAAVSALGRMRAAKALAHCRQLLWPKTAAAGPLAAVALSRTETMAIVRALHSRDDAPAKALLQEIAGHADPVLAAAAKVTLPAVKTPAKAKLTLSPDRVVAEGTFGTFFGDSYTLADAFPGVPTAELSTGDCDTFDFPDHAVVPAKTSRLFLNQGSLVNGEVLAITADQVRVRSPLFGELALPRKDVQGIAFDPALDRLVGASTAFDRVRMRDATFVEGALLRGDASTLVSKPAEGAERSLAIGEVSGVLFTRPSLNEPDTTTYSRVDLVTASA
jgi:hypothetical protein